MLVVLLVYLSLVLLEEHVGITEEDESEDRLTTTFSYILFFSRDYYKYNYYLCNKIKSHIIYRYSAWES